MFVGACFSPYSVVGAAFSPRVRNRTPTYDMVRRTCQALIPSDHVSEAGSAEKEDPTPLEGLFGLWFFSFLQHITPAPLGL